MRIGIETIYDGYNFGCYLQAYAMQTFLEEAGHEVVVIDHSNFKSRIARRYFAKSYKRTLVKIRRFLTFRKSWKKLNIFSFSNISNLDLTIIGSDEVWNIENPSFEHLPQFYGIGCKGNVNLAYGPSLGYSTLDSYKNHSNLTNSIRQNIKYFYVRDGFTETFLHNIGIEKVSRVCDPTFLIYDQWKSLRQDYSINDDYLLYYSYHDETPFKNYILKFAKARGLKVVVAGFNYKWCDKQLIVNPFQFLDLVSKAKYVVTSTFHGSIFSILFEKKFVVIHPNDKVVDLLARYGVDNLAKVDCEYESFKDVLIASPNYDSVFKRIIEDVRSSRELLCQSVCNI